MNDSLAVPATTSAQAEALRPTDHFAPRHIGPNEAELSEMLKPLGYDSLNAFSDAIIPEAIRLTQPLNLPAPLSESEAISQIRRIASKNVIKKSFIGAGYYGTITPPIILRNILENPGWYTQYTPYQAEISQGRLEALLNFQTVISDLTGLPQANASLLDEATAAAEAMNMARSIVGDDAGNKKFFVSSGCHPQTIALVQTRAKWLGIQVVVGDEAATLNDAAKVGEYFGVLLQYPATDGTITDYGMLIEQIHAAGGVVVMATDLLALTMIKSPGEYGADVAIGSAQRFGVPMGFGGPHAAFMATKTEHVRKMPGRVIGVSKDVHGNPALRLALQTREQHIRRDKATSNICTAQVLLAIMAGMYAVYHGPQGVKKIAQRTHTIAGIAAEALKQAGHTILNATYFDTLHVKPATDAAALIKSAAKSGSNVRDFGDGTVGLSFDETTSAGDLKQLLVAFGADGFINAGSAGAYHLESSAFNRTSAYLTHPVFSKYHGEHEMLRYIKKLESRDLSLCQSNIPLGSCTMKLNATTEMLPITWPEFAELHPFAPADQSRGYAQLFKDLETWLAEITGFAACSLQPNAGSAGEYAGLLTIRNYQEAKKQGHRNICLIPTSAHGTNPASAVMAGLKVVPVACDDHGNIDIADVKARAEEHRDNLSCIMVTYPSTHGVFEEGIREICAIIHDNGGQVYMDGANMNAQVGLTSPGHIGADVCHLNLHKTFCIPHGGGGPGVGPICVAKHLAKYLPGHPATNKAGKAHPGPVAAAPHGSASILPISWTYIAMMGYEGLRKATQVAMLNANYMAKRLAGHYPVLYRGKNGLCAHEFILDIRELEHTSGIKVEDIAKRLMDYGFHAPTMSWPVHSTLMFEPTESESKYELDRMCDAMIAIRAEIQAVVDGKADKNDNALKNAPHTALAVTDDNWTHAYSRQDAAYPAAWLKGPDGYKFWPHVGRIDNPWGDRNLMCTCAPVA